VRESFIGSTGSARPYARRQRRNNKNPPCEDDPASGRLVSAAVRKLGYEVILASNGRDAWYSYVSERPRIVITDWMMPVIDGIELSRRIARTTFALHVSDHADGARRAGAVCPGMRAGVDDFMTKPLDLDMLRVRLTMAERILVSSTGSRNSGLLPICSYCKRIRNEEGPGRTSDIRGSADQRLVQSPALSSVRAKHPEEPA